MKNKIVVVGSCNVDLVVQSPYFPKPGETIIGKNFQTFGGGKGANQAVAAARLGGHVHFLCKTGYDEFGANSIMQFKKDGIATDFILRDDREKTGVAFIIVDQHGQNSIIVSPGANATLSIDDIESSKAVFEHAGVILVQLEIPIETVNYVVRMEHLADKKIILNPAPAVQLADEIYPRLFLITPNETETEILSGIKVSDERSASGAADYFLAKGVQNVIITLGAQGSFFKNKEEEFLIAAEKVNVVDTTAAGDVFNGAVAVFIAENKGWRETLSFANKAAGFSVGKMGAQSSAPCLEEL